MTAICAANGSTVSTTTTASSTRLAVEAYVRFVVEQPLVVAAAYSLTELFAPSIHRERIARMLANYDFVNDDVMAYFKRRLSQAPRDATFALEFVKANARTRELQCPARRALPRLRSEHDPARCLPARVGARCLARSRINRRLSRGDW